MPPTMPHRVTITTTLPPEVDPATGKQVTPPPAVAAGVRARLSRTPIANSSDSDENNSGQGTTLSDWTVLLPAGTAVTSGSRLTDATGRTFEVIGEPAKRPDHRPRFIAAAVRLISDMQ